MKLRVMLIPGIEGTIPRSIRNYHEALARFLQSESRGELVVESFAPRLSWLPRDRRLRANYLDLARLFLAPAQLRRLRADVFHILDHSHGAWVRSLGPDRTVVTCHDLIPFARPEMWRTRWGRTFGRRMFALNVRRMGEARAVIAPSAATHRDIYRFRISDFGFRTADVGIGTDRSLPNPKSEIRNPKSR